MKCLRTWFCAVAILQFCACTALAADETFIESAGVLSATGGKVARWIKPIPCPAGQFTTLISISDVTPRGEWEGSAQILIRSDHRAATFTLQTVHKKPPLVARARQLRLGSLDPDEKHFEFSGQYQPDQPVSVNIEWTTAQEVRVTVGKERATMTLQEPITTFELTGSGGTATFDKNILTCSLTS